MLINTLKKLLPFLSLVMVIVFVFRDLPQTFYQQDEWNGLGLVFSEDQGLIFDGVARRLDLFFAKGRILSNGVFYLFLKYFPFQNSQLSVSAVFLHLLATFLMFTLIKRFTKSNFISLLGATFFAVNAVSHGAITWPFVAISTVISTILVLLAIWFYFKYLDDTKKRWLIVSGGLIYLSLWFKESGLYLFFFLPFAAFLFNSYKVKIFLKQFWWFLITFFIIVAYRILELRFGAPDPNLYISGASENFFLTILIRMIIYPLTSFSLMFIPGNYFLSFARYVMGIIYPFLAPAANNILIAQTVVLDLLAVILTSIILLAIYVFFKEEKTEIKRMVTFWLIFTFMSFLPYVVLSKDFSYLESRYYYLPVVGGAFLFSWVLKRVWESLGRKIFFVVVVPLCALYLIFHANVVRGAIAEQVKLSDLRRNFISQLKLLVPNLDQRKNIFYITSDQNYWADENKIPFQQGTGYTLMVLYYDSGKIPKEFLKDGYLFEIGGQGYREIEEHGFGYFSDKEKLDEAIKFYNLPKNSIIDLRWDSSKQELTRGND